MQTGQVVHILISSASLCCQPTVMQVDGLIASRFANGTSGPHPHRLRVTVLRVTVLRVTVLQVAIHKQLANDNERMEGRGLINTRTASYQVPAYLTLQEAA